MRNKILVAVFTVLALGVVVFIVDSMRKSATPIVAGKPPELKGAPARVYGVIEPLGREVFVSPAVSRRVVDIRVKEGDPVKKGDVLAVLENSVETGDLKVAERQVEQYKSQLAMSEEVLRRNRELINRKVIAVGEYTDNKLLVQYQTRQLEVAQAQAELARARLQQLYLQSPIDGIVYKFDVRLGESLTAGDTTRIVLGANPRQVRLFVEAFWMDRVKIGGQYEIMNVETNERIGTGTVKTVAPYLGRRDFRTEDPQERFDTKYQQVVLDLDTGSLPLPKLGLAVLAILPP